MTIPNVDEAFFLSIALLAARHRGGTALEERVNQLTADQARAALLSQTVFAGLLFDDTCAKDHIDPDEALLQMSIHATTSTKGKKRKP